MTRIDLTGSEIVATGRTRDVYRHPHDASLLVKVIRPASIEERYGSGQPWYKLRKRRYRHFISYLREVREHIAVRALRIEHPAYLQNIVGFADTEFGLGLVVEAVRGRDGNYAPTVASLIKRDALDRDLMAKLDQFFDELVASPVILADLNIYNIVCGYTPERGDHFVLIDGIGHKTVIPFERFSRRINRWSSAAKVKRVRAEIARRTAAATAAAGSATSLSLVS